MCIHTRQKKMHNRKVTTTTTTTRKNQDRKGITKQTLKNKKNLNERTRCPKYIKCGNNLVVNHDKPSTISLGISKGILITDKIHDHLRDILNTYGQNRIIIGCVAWLTSETLISSLAKASKVSLLVNHQDFQKWGFGTVTREKYKVLPKFNVPFKDVWGEKIETPLNLLPESYEAVRCVGGIDNSTTGKNAVMVPLMHAKFIVICDDNHFPRWLWHGSMNFTENSQSNLEMVAFFDDPTFALHAFNFFSKVFLESKPVQY